MLLYDLSAHAPSYHMEISQAHCTDSVMTLTPHSRSNFDPHTRGKCVLPTRILALLHFGLSSASSQPRCHRFGRGPRQGRGDDEA
ncbi:hypothetical protein BJV74DRAFT_816817 [Russula compacta]|nr:hypothetical protein BJV74DRAFT_816817 [Russula compacta]